MRERFVPRRNSWVARHPVASDVLVGAIGGAAATWAMTRATTWLYDRESSAARQREDNARGGETAFARAAGRLAGAADVTLDREQRARVGTALHWTTGIAAGIGYALARRRWPPIAVGGGLAFGFGFFMLMDEGVNTLFGFTPPPRAFPWQAHARGAAGHAVFGVATHLIARSVDPFRRQLRRQEVLLSTM